MKKMLLSGALAASTMIGASAVSAGIIQLGFVLDRSGSIGSGNWDIITEGLSNAIDNIPVPVDVQDDTYEISVVSFASSATIDIKSVEVDSLVSRDALKASIALLGTSRDSSGLTNYEDAFVQMLDALDDSTGVNFSYVNFATDGNPTTSNTSGNNNDNGIAARNALMAWGVDNLSIEGIGNVSALNLKDNYCGPGTCDTTDPYNFPAQGFYIGVANAQGYADAIGNKVLIVTGQAPTVPVPGTIALLGLGLAGLASVRRKRIAA